MRRSITFHGLALNVNADLAYFSRIIPCGLSWADVTSMNRELGKQQSADRVKERFLHHFAELFGYSDIKEGLENLNSQPVEKVSGTRPAIVPLNVLNRLNVLN